MKGMTTMLMKKGPLGMPMFVLIAVIAVVAIIILAMVLLLALGSGSGESSPENAVKAYYNALSKENSNDAFKFSTAGFADEDTKDAMRAMWNVGFLINTRYSLSNVEVMSDAEVEDYYGQTTEHLDGTVKDLCHEQGITKTISEVRYVQFDYTHSYDGGSTSDDMIVPVCKIDGRWYTYAWLIS